MEHLNHLYGQKKEQIRQRLCHFSSIRNEDIFYELCFCLLTPQSKGKKCDEAVQRLMAEGFSLHDLDLERLLRTHTRFHNHKAAYLRLMKEQYPLILEHLAAEKDAFALRSWLVCHVRGMGMKEASHFLRNIGYRGLAILDRHILKQLVSCRVIDTIPKTLSLATYLEIEQRFLDFSKRVNIDMDELDLLFWSNETGEVFK